MCVAVAALKTIWRWRMDWSRSWSELKRCTGRCCLPLFTDFFFFSGFLELLAEKLFIVHALGAEGKGRHTTCRNWRGRLVLLVWEPEAE